MVKLYWFFIASSVAMEKDGFFLAIIVQGQGIYKQKRWELIRTLFLQLAANDCILEIDRLQSH